MNEKTLESPPVKLKLAQTTNQQEALNFIRNIPFEEAYADWRSRISKFL